MADLLKDLRDLEEELHDFSTRCNAERLREILHPQFREIGQSGRVYDREQIIAELAGSTDNAPIHAVNFELQELTDGIALLFYSASRSSVAGDQGFRSRRSSLWTRTPIGWQMRFHQGTAYSR